MLREAVTGAFLHAYVRMVSLCAFHIGVIRLKMYIRVVIFFVSHTTDIGDFDLTYTAGR